MVQKLGLKLGLSKKQLDQFIKNLPSEENQLKSDAQMKRMNQLTVDTFNLVSDWYHDAILELSRIPGFEGTPQFISKRLGITVTEARLAIERLIRIGLMESTPDGRLKEILGDTSTTIDIDFTNSALQNLQRQVLAISLNALETIRKQERDHTCMTMAIAKRDLLEAKKRIKKFRQELMSFLQRDGVQYDEVYQMAVSLYPLTRLTKD